MVAINPTDAKTFVQPVYILKECVVAINPATAEMCILKECMIAINPAAAETFVL